MVGHCSDIEPKSFQGNERKQLVRYHKLALISSDWFWETDENFIIMYMSSSVKRITGISKETYIGVSRFDLASGDTRKTQMWADHMVQARRHEPIKNFEYKHAGTSGKVVYLRVNATPLFDEDGLFIGYLGRTTDISQLVLAKEKVDRANAKLEAQTFELEAAKRSAEAIRSCSRTSDISGRLRKNTVEEMLSLAHY